ncbi:MAG: prolyl oligopeptidase family serine peptidase [Actinomycetota bacterium]
MEQMPAWEVRIRARRLGLPRPARDAQDRAVAVATTDAGTIELHWWRTGDQTIRQATDRVEGTIAGMLDPTGEYLWWFDDRSGDEKGVWRRQIFDSPPGNCEDATRLPAAYSSGLALGVGVAVVGSSDEGGVRIHLVEGDHEARLLYSHTEEASVGDLSRDDSLVAIEHSEHGDSRHPAIRVLRVTDGSTVGDLHDGPGKAVHPIAFAPGPGDSRLLVLHERAGTPALMIWDPVQGNETEITVDAPGEVEDADWWPDGRSVLVALSHQARTRLVRVTLDTLTTERIGPDAGTVRAFTVLGDGQVWASWSSAAESSSIRRFELTTTAPGDVLLRPPGPTAPPSVAVTDLWVDGPGGPIHALLRRPTGADTTFPLPLIVEAHGGPTAHDVDAFDPYASAWVDHGFAVVQVNYRGSTGYGAAWRDALEARVGHTELADIRAVRDHLVDAGIADSKRVVLAGASWGGYLTLLGLGTQPEAWSLGIAGVPVADYVAAYEDEMDALKAFDRSLFGGSPADVPERYADASPINYVDSVRAPVLILAGANDPRCPIRQIDNYVECLRRNGTSHQVYRYDAGHGSLVNDERVRQLRVELDFVAQHLKAQTPNNSAP